MGAPRCPKCGRHHLFGWERPWVYLAAIGVGCAVIAFVPAGSGMKNPLLWPFVIVTGTVGVVGSILLGLFGHSRTSRGLIYGLLIAILTIPVVWYVVQESVKRYPNPLGWH